MDPLQINQETFELRRCSSGSDATLHGGPLLHGRLAALPYLLPFDTDMRCLLVTDAAQQWSQGSQMTFWIVFFPFFPVTKNYLFDDGHQCNPGPLRWTRRLLPLVFWDHICFKWIVSTCVRVGGLDQVDACVSVRACVRDVFGLAINHVQEDASLTTHIPLDAFKSV